MGMIRIGRRVLRVAAALLFSALWIALLLIPSGARTGEAEERYDCLWSDGTRTQLKYEEAYRALSGIDGDGNIVLAKGDTSGTVAPSAAFFAAEAALRSGGLAELFSVSAADTGRLERAALWRTYRDRVWYGEGFFVWSGARVERVNSAVASDMVLLSGSISAQMLKNTGATRLELRGSAQISASALIGTAVTEIEAEPPYAAGSGAVYLDTAGGRRLIAGIPAAERVCVRGNGFADRGALLPCIRLKELTLDFLGSARYAPEEGSQMLAYLFQNGTDYAVPEDLKKLTVLGGAFPEEALYRCYGLEEVILCGLEAEEISARAFSGCTGLKLLHTPRRLSPPGNFSERPLDCGCWEYSWS